MLKLIICCFPLLMMQCKSKDKVVIHESDQVESPSEILSNKTMSNNDLKTDQVELKLQARVKPQRIIASFNKYKLGLECIKDKQQNIVVFSFDPEVIGRDALVEFLHNEVGVIHCTETIGC